MKNPTKLTLSFIILFIHFNAFSQKCPQAKSFKGDRNLSELSAGIGASHYFGDLNAINVTNKRIIGELHSEQLNPVVSVDYRYYFSHIANLRVGFLYTRLNGSDQFNAVQEDFSAPWFRKYRNLTFRSDILELSALFELNLLGFEPGNFKRVVSPYILAGAGVIYFNPKAPYNEELYNHHPGEKNILMSNPDYSNSEWIRLQPLGTEGQGLPGYPDKYSLVQPIFIGGVGLKFNISSSWSLTVETAHHFTLTDYLDDVSTVYSDEQIFFQHYDPEKAQLISNLSARSKEIDPSGEYNYITATGQQRGSPKYKDSFLTSFVSAGYTFQKK